MNRPSKPSRYVRLAEALAQARASAGLSQTALSVRLGKPQSYVSKYENADRRLDLVELLDVVDAIGCSDAEIIAQVRDGKAPSKRRGPVRSG